MYKNNVFNNIQKQNFVIRLLAPLNLRWHAHLYYKIVLLLKFVVKFQGTFKNYVSPKCFMFFGFMIFLLYF